MEVVMRYKHDCVKCKPLGQFAEYDLYYCDKFCGETIPTVIARYGDEELDYITGLHTRGLPIELPPLKIASAMAIELGYMEDSL